MAEQQVEERRVVIPWWVHDAIADESPLRTIFCTGGLGGGKSHGGQIWDIYRCLQNGVPMTEAKPSMSWTVAPNYRICETLLNLTLQVAQDVFGMREGVHYKLRRSFPRVIDFSRSGLKHHLYFLSADNPEHFVADSITHWRWSEVGVSKPEVFEKLADRLRDPRAKVLQGLGDGTPEGMNHYADIADLPGEGRDRVDPKRNRRRFIVETGDNAKNLAPGYLEALRSRYGHDKSKLLSYEKGLFVPFTKGSAYWAYCAHNLVDQQYADPFEPLLFCWDFNVSPLAWVVAQRQWVQEYLYGPRYQRYTAIDESDGDARGTLDGVAEFVSRFPVYRFGNTPIHIYGDRNGYSSSHKITGSDFQEIEHLLQKAGYQNVEIRAQSGANPRIKQRLEKVAQLMAYQMLVAGSNCRRLISSFTKTSLKKGTWDIEKPDGEDWTHYGDAIGYAMYQLFKDVNIADPDAKVILGAG